MTCWLAFAVGVLSGFAPAALLGAALAGRIGAQQAADLEERAFGADLPEALIGHGYRVHSRLGGGGWWWTWAVDGVAGIAASDGEFPTQYRAWDDALRHYLANSRPEVLHAVGV